MAKYLRHRVPGGTYAFTVNADRRRPIFAGSSARQCLRNAFGSVRRQWAFELLAVVVLPDHLHAIWVLPEDDSNYSLRWQKIKERFTRAYLAGGGREGRSTQSQRRYGERAVWQRRFWEHTCRDEEDLKRCLDYVHWNPVKHGLVSRVLDYPWSSFHRFVKLGEYQPDWGGENPCPGFELGE